MATSEPEFERQKSREELELPELKSGAKPYKRTTTQCSVEVITTGPPFGEPDSKQQQHLQQKVQFSNDQAEQPERLDFDGPRCLGRAGTVHNPDPPELVASAADELYLSERTPTTPGVAGPPRDRFASMSDGSKKPYINLHKVSYHNS